MSWGLQCYTGFGNLPCDHLLTRRLSSSADAMAHLLRGKHAGVQSDLSRGVAAEFFMLDDVSRRRGFGYLNC